ncbi:MAG: hypothetical protein ACOYT8_01220 [Candidatus Dependentiae bacterium]
MRFYYLILLSCSVYIFGAEDFICPSLKEFALKKTLDLMPNHENMRKNLTQKIVAGQLGYALEKPLARKIVADSGNEIAIAQVLMNKFSRPSFTTHLMIEPHSKWKLCNNHIIVLHYQKLPILLNAITGEKETVTFLPYKDNERLMSNCFAINHEGAIIAHAEGKQHENNSYYSILLWKPEQKKLLKEISLKKNYIPRKMVFSAQGKFIALSYTAKRKIYTDILDTKTLHKFKTVQGSCGKFSKDEQKFYYYTTPDNDSLYEHSLQLNTGIVDDDFRIVEMKCSKRCHEPDCLKRKITWMIDQKIVLHHQTENTFYQIKNDTMVFPQLFVDEVHDGSALKLGKTIEIYDNFIKKKVGNFTIPGALFSAQIELVCPRADLIVLSTENSPNLQVYSIKTNQLIQELPNARGLKIELSQNNNYFMCKGYNRWQIIPTHHFYLDHTPAQELVKTALSLN